MAVNAVVRLVVIVSMKTRLLITVVITMMVTIPFVTYSMLDWYDVYYGLTTDVSSDINNSPKFGDKYYIEPERKAHLEAVELDLRNKISQLHQKSPLTAYAVNLDHATKKIVVIVETEQFNPEIKEIISQYPDDVPIVFYNSKIELQDEFDPEEKSAYEVTKEFEGVIIDQRLSKEHKYHFFTNELSKINTGSSGIQLEGIDNRDNLDGKYVKLFGSISKKGEEIIIVDAVDILYSIIPAGVSEKVMLQTSINEIHENPDKYYNQMISIKGELREHDADVMVHTGVGCDNAKFTTSDEFVAEFISSQLLYDDAEDKHLGVRIGSADNIGISKSERLPIELKNNQVEIIGIFVPAIRDMNWCNAIIYKSGYILTDYDKIKVIE